MAKTRRDYLFEEQNGICCLLALGMCCLPDKPMTLDKRGTPHGEDDFATYEHLRPTSLGGAKQHSSDNVKLAHRRCNERKGNLLAIHRKPKPPPLPPDAVRRLTPFSYAWLVARGYIELET